MLESLEKIHKESLVNDSYTYDDMHNSLSKAFQSSYHFLNEKERQRINHTELYYVSDQLNSHDQRKDGKFYIRDNKTAFDFQYALLAHYGRDTFRRGDFYKQEISFDTLLENPSLFPKIPIITIDGKTIWDASFYIQEDYTTVILPLPITFFRKLTSDSNATRRGTTYKITKTNSGVELEASKDGSIIDIPSSLIPSRIQNILYYLYANTVENVLPIIESNILSWYSLDEVTENSVTVTSIVDDYIYIKHMIQINMIDNIFYQRIELNKSSTSYNKSTKKIRIEKSMFRSIPFQDGMMFCSMHFPNAFGLDYELGTPIFSLDEYDDYYEATLSDGIADTFNSSRVNTKFSFFFIHHIHKHIFYTGKDFIKDDKYFVIEKSSFVPYDLPIPVDNIITFRKTKDDSDFYLVTDLMDDYSKITQYYPNLYKITDEEESAEYKIYYFYEEVNGVKYTPAHNFYYLFIQDISGDRSLEEMVNLICLRDAKSTSLTSFEEEHPEINSSDFETLYATFIKILLYWDSSSDSNPMKNLQFGSYDFLYNYLPENFDAVELQYKVDYMKEWTLEDQNKWMLNDYVKYQKKKGNILHLWVNTIDLSERVRTSFNPEFSDKYDTFDENMYIFAISDSLIYPKMLNVRIFVDGIFIEDFIQERNEFVDYLYIPTRYVTEDSYIELEIFEDGGIFEEVTFDSLEDIKQITIVEPNLNVAPTVADIVFYNPERYIRYYNNLFLISANYNEGDYDLVTEDESKPINFTRLNTFSIKPLSTNVLNTPILIQVTKIAKGIPTRIETNGFPFFTIVEQGFGLHPDFIRIYRNGRILPRNKYHIFDSYAMPKIQFYEEFQRGDTLYFDITPYRYTQIYYQADIDDETLIDLKSIADKPFDPRYYDIYLNGRRLSINNVFMIDPWTISLVNIHSKHNLLIFEKERDWEYFGIDYNTHSYFFSVDDLLNEPYITEEERKKIIDRIIDEQKDPHLTITDNDDTEEIEDYDDPNHTIIDYTEVNIFYHSEMVERGSLNPDVKQLTEDVMIKDYAYINDICTVSPTTDARDTNEMIRRQKYPKAVLINGDMNLSPESSDENEDNPYILYIVGHLNPTEDILKNSTLTMPTKVTIDEEE